jgi:hypothetical protein
MLTTIKRALLGITYCLLAPFLLSNQLALADPTPSAALADDSAPAAAPADTASSNFKISGFLSIIGGNVFNGSFGPNYQANAGPATLNGKTCPCYVADYSNAGVYGSNFSIQPETHGGVQLQYNFSPDLNFVGQVTAHTQEDSPAIQWAYFSYRINESWEVHVGRQRIPMYYYSQFQDVGFAYPWIDPPPELYGWEATNYDGASLRYTTNFGNVNFTSSVFNGIEKLGNSQFYKSYYSGDTDVEWSAILGADAEINDGPLTMRAVYLQANTSIINTSNYLNLYAPMKTYGVATNLDFDTWFVLSEITQQVRDYNSLGYTTTSPSSTIGAGYRWGKWTPFINYGIFTSHSTNAALVPPSDYKRDSLTLRYDIDSGSDAKLQLDRSYDSTNNQFGNTSVVRLSYDRVF